MKRLFWLLLLLVCLCGCDNAEPTVPQTLPASAPAPTGTSAPPETAPEILPPQDADFVLVTDYIPGIFAELKYAGADNFTGQTIYRFSDAYLRYGTVCKLAAVQEELESMGCALKIWDAFRPISAQFTLWEAYPDPSFVANPNTTYSGHSRGNTLDLTLTDLQGRELEMPTAFDDFSAKADRDYSDCPETAAKNAALLQNLMEKHGFTGYHKEWWHFTDSQTYPAEFCFDPALISQWYVHGGDTVAVYASPDAASALLTALPQWEIVTLLGYDGSFALVDHNGLRGYVHTDCLRTTEPMG